MGHFAISMTVFGFSFSLFLGILSFTYLKKRRPQTPFPPSRPRLPIFGNFFEIPQKTPGVTYAAWSRELQSDVISVWSFGQLSIIFNSTKAVQDLFEQRSALYSDKPQTSSLSMSGWDFFIAFLPYSDKWRAHRRIFQQRFRETALPHYQPLQKASVERLLKVLYEQPDNVTESTRTNVAALSMGLIYGYDVAPKNDTFVSALDRAADMIAEVLFPGTMAAVAAVPALRHLPEWLPGMRFKKHCRICHSFVMKMRRAPLAFVRNGMVEGTAKASILRSMLKDNEENGGSVDGEQLAMDVSAGIYAGMTDTTSIALSTTIYALLTHPQVQKRAQEELDAVIGRDRLPAFEDRADLPYVNAICRELMRWRPVFPLGLPRMSKQDDVYEGMFIPKGTMLLPNAWGMLHNPDVYPDPEAFKPERFLTEDGGLNDDEVLAAFGFGRRVCPGRNFAMSTLYMTVACLLSVFNIRPKKDENGKDIPVNVTYTDGLSSRPSAFECKFQPRDADAERVLKEIVLKEIVENDSKAAVV